MKFTFHENESFIYDFCMFPKLLYVKDEDINKLNEVLGDEASHAFLDHEAHKKFTKAAQKDLEPYKDPLLGYYADEVISNYDFPALLFRSYSFLGYNDYKTYLQDIMKDDEDTITKNLIYALLTVEQSDDELDEEAAYQEAESCLNNRDELLQLIRNTPTTENHRWILMLLIESPKEYLEAYARLLDTIKPIFDRYLLEYKSRIDRFKKEVINPLKTEGEDAFKRLTHDIVPTEVLDEENRVITSFVNPYRYSMITSGQDRFILWSLEMKTGFQQIAEFEESSRKNRAKVFKTLSDETRYDVLRHLARGITSTKVIASSIGVSSATVTYHINAFLTVKIIRVVKSKKAKYVIDYNRLEVFWQDFMRDLKEQ